MSCTTRITETAGSTPLISVVLPLFNERAVLRQLYDDVTRSLRTCGGSWEVIFVNDGSSDGSDAVLDHIAAQDRRARVLHLSRNFGHQAAVQAGLTYARGQAVIVMDSDLQDDPSCLTTFVGKWQAGYDVVFAVRTNRKEGLLKRALFFAFYRMLNAISNTPLPNDAGNFGLISRPVVDQLVQLNEYDRYYSGLRRWVGFKQIGVPVERGARHDGTPRVTLWGLFRLAKTAVFSFSSAPLSTFYAIAGFAFVLFASLATWGLWHKLSTGLDVPAGTTTVMAGSLLGTLNALGIAVLGEYIVRIYDQVRGRPGFIVARDVNGPSGDVEARSKSAADIGELLVASAVDLQTDVSDALSVTALSVAAEAEAGP